MIFATDVHYTENSASAAGILFTHWRSDNCKETIVKVIDKVADYHSGQFYKRELPCIMALLQELEIPPDTIVVDGYVTLGEKQKPGLGMHLYGALQQSIPVIGVAKNAFTGTPAECELIRGVSRNPLYITSVGIPLEIAKQHILSMHGGYRIPTLLKQVDQLCRSLSSK